MDQQNRDNRNRRYGGGGGGRASQGDASRGSRRRRERRSRWANGGLASFRRATVFLLQLLLPFGLQIISHFDHEVGATIYHYDVQVRAPADNDLPLAGAAPEVSQAPVDLSAVKAELFRLYAARFPAAPAVAYDGQRRLLTLALLPEGDFQVAVHGRVFNVTLKLVKKQQQLVPSLGSWTRAVAEDPYYVISLLIDALCLWVRGRSCHFTM